MWRLRCLLMVALNLAICLAQAQDSAIKDASVRDVLETGEKTEQLIQERVESAQDPHLAQETPLGAMLTLGNLLRERDYKAAGDILDMRYVQDELHGWTPEDLIRALDIVWEQHHVLDISAISDAPGGNVNDGLPLHLEHLGTLPFEGEQIPVLMQSVPTDDGRRVWKISGTTVARVPDLWDEWGYSQIALYLSDALPDVTFADMENWQLLFILLFLLLAWPCSILISALLLRVALLIPNDFPDGIERFFQGPIRFFIFILLARLLIDQLSLSITARIFLSSSGIDYIAFAVLLMGGLSLFRDYQIRRLQRLQLPQYAALLRPITTTVKLLLLIAIALIWAEQAGYNMTTILAGLGIGSLAVALAAQKTLENVFGAITLYLARPVKAGDFCRFKNILGHVEEIGLRSTTLRTLDNTLVCVPNSEFSSTQVENITARSTIRFNSQLRVKLASANHLHRFIQDLRKLFLQHEEVLHDTVSVSLKEIEEDTAILRLNSHIDTQDYEKFLGVTEKLNLGAIQLASESGIELCGPSLLVSVDPSDTPGRTGF